MTLKLTELEEFVDKLRSNGIREMKKQDLRKAIKRHWDIASEFSVKTRYEALMDENLVKEHPNSTQVLKVKKPEMDKLDDIFREEKDDEDSYMED